MSNPPTIRDQLLTAGVRNLQAFGYPAVTKENILTDRIYSRFFDRMLEDHQGNAEVVAELRAVIKGGGQ